MAEQVRVPEEVWAILYHDAGVKHEVFVGEGAKEAAKETHIRRLDNWNCVLLGPSERISALERALCEIADHKIQRPWAECARIARAALAAEEGK